MENAYLTPLLLSAILGAAMGIERSLSGKHAGMRTYALVSLGSCLFVALGTMAAYELREFGGVNPVQVAGNIVVAIGFLGAGLTVFRGEHPVELTTAAGLWVAAAVGMACGFFLYTLAIVAMVLSILIFSFLAKIERHLSARYGTKHEG